MRFLSIALSLTVPPALQAVDYAKEIQPLWEQHCVDCHAGEDGDGGFALDTHAALLKGGESGAAVLPGKAAESLLVKFLLGTSGKTGKNQFMPPGKRDHLSEAEVALVRRWIDEGAKTGSAPQPVRDPLAQLPGVKPLGSARPIHSVAANAAGTLLALGRYGKVELVDAEKKTLLRELSGLEGKASEMAFGSASAAQGELLYVAAGDAGVSGRVYIFSTKDGAMLRTMPAGADALYALALSPDEKLLATAGYDQKISLWELPSGKLLRVLKGHNGSVNAVAFRPDGKVLASASADRTVKLWEVATGARLDTFSQPTKEQTTLVFGSGGRQLFAGGADNRIRVWSVSEKAVEGSNQLLATSFAAEGAVLKLALSADGKTLLCSAADRSIKVWQTEPLLEKLLLERQSDWANALAWYQAGRFLAARQDGTAALYAADQPAALGPLVMAKAAAPVVKKQAKAAAAAMKLELLRAVPAGIVCGHTVSTVLEGKNLSAVKTVKLSDARLSVKLSQQDATHLELLVTAAKDLPRGAYTLTATGKAGDTATLKMYADDLPQITLLPKEPLTAAVNAWGVLREIGQRDDYRFSAKKGETLVLDAAVRAIGSKAATPQLEVFNAQGARLAFSRGLDSGTDPFIAFTAGEAGTYTVRVSETTLDGSADHAYRLTIGTVPYIVGWWPLTVPPLSESKLQLVGYNLPMQAVTLKSGEKGEVALPAELSGLRRRSVMLPTVGVKREVLEAEPNDALAQAQRLELPVSVNGLLQGQEIDADWYTFEAKGGERWILETTAAQRGSPVDTKLEVLHADSGKPVEQVRLRAMRDSWNNFRSVDANNPDIRLEFWREMDLNDYVYMSGDVMRIFRNPRGPDGGFLFYNVGNKRRAYFGTTAAGHALEEPAYIVQPLQAGEEPVPNGLPVFSIPYANDDEGTRALGRDSRVDFTAPAAGRYVVRVTDSRRWVGARFAYRLHIRAPQPDFSVVMEGGNAAVNAGGSKGFSLRATRADGFEGEIKVVVQGLPKGWHASSPVVIEQGQLLATGSLTAEVGAEMDFSQLKVLASAQIAGKPVSKEVPGFGKPTLAAKAKFVPQLERSLQGKPMPRSGAEPAVITLVAGGSVPAFIRVERNGEEGLLNFDVHNLPFGVIVDNIGLNGVQVRAQENEREIYLSAAKWVPEQERLIHAAVASARGGQESDGLATSYPVLLRVVKEKVAKN